MPIPRSIHRPAVVAFAVALVSLLASCGPVSQQPEAPETGAAIVIAPDVPHDVHGRRLPPSVRANEVLAAFAWQQFLALSWQSDYGTENVDPIRSYIRGTPDTSWDYSMPYTKPLVWETYAHRSELRPFAVPLTRSFNSPPQFMGDTP